MNNKTNTLELTDFLKGGGGRNLNFNLFKETDQAASALVKAKKDELAKRKPSDFIEKGELGNALGYDFARNNKFKKKGSEIIKKVEALVALVQTKKDQCLVDMAAIVEDLDFAPVQKLDQWDLKDVTDDAAKALKRYEWNQCNYNSNTAGVDCTTSSDKANVVCASNEEESKKCYKYNELMWQYLDCCRDLAKAATFIRNVDEETSYEFSLEELKSLGF